MGGVALNIMLRFGILPTLIRHYSVDAMYSAMLMIRSESLYYKLSGLGAAGIMLLPVAIALVAYWRGGGFLPEDGLLNRDDTAEPQSEPQPAPQRAQIRRARCDVPAALPHHALDRRRRPHRRTRHARHPRRALRRHTGLQAHGRPGTRLGRRLPTIAGHRPGGVPTRHLSRGALGRWRFAGR